MFSVSRNSLVSNIIAHASGTSPAHSINTTHTSSLPMRFTNDSALPSCPDAPLLILDSSDDSNGLALDQVKITNMNMHAVFSLYSHCVIWIVCVIL